MSRSSHVGRLRGSGRTEWWMAAVGTQVLVSALGVMIAGSSGAQTLPFCGGQNAPPRPVPYTCRTQTQTIDGSQVMAVFARRRSDGDGHLHVAGAPGY